MPETISKTRKKLIRSGIGRRPVQSLLPDLQAAAYAKKLQTEIERGFNLVRKRLFPVLKSLESLQRVDTVTDDAGRANEVLNEILNSFFGGMLSKDQPNLGRYSRKVAAKLVNPMQTGVDKFNAAQFKKQFKRISGVDPLKSAAGISDALEVAGQHNVDKIVTVNSNYFDQIRESSNRALRKGTSYGDLKTEIVELTEATQQRAKLIAVDQVQKLNADLEQTRQKGNGISRYFWRTRRNARVRSKANSKGYSDHAGLEGAVIDYNHPPVTVLSGKRAGETNHPGHDINCKCWSEPVLEDLTGKSSGALEEGEKITRRLISENRIPGYTLPELKKKAS